MAKSNSEYKSIQKKLVAAVAMVLVASVMVVSSSYAWFTLSTAPEVTGITTSVGSNGNLEMALRTKGDLDLITTATGESFPTANNYWGNLVDLSHSSYHLDSVALAPARLNIVLDTANSDHDFAQYIKYSNAENTYAVDAEYEPGEVITNVITEAGSYTVDGATYTHKHTITTNKEVLVKPAYKLNGAAGTAPYLQTPVYGTDGRLSGLSADNVINGTYNPDANGFAESATGSWGVRAIGTTNALTPAEMALRTAKRTVSSAITSAQSDASTSLRVDAVKLANILINKELVADYSISDADVTAIQTALRNLDAIADSLENAMVQSVLAVSVAQNAGLKAEDISFDDGTIDATGIDWSGIPALEATLNAAAATLKTMRSEISTSVGHANTAAAAAAGSDERNTAVTNAMAALLNSNDFTIIDSRNGNTYSVTAIKNLADTAPVTAAGVLLNTPIISIGGGIYHDIALFSGNYSADASMKVNVVYGSIDLSNETINVTMSTNATEPSYKYSVTSDDDGNPDTPDTTIEVPVTGYYLSKVLVELNTVTVTEDASATSYKIITDIYGYAIDLAFRTNAAGSSLLLQTEAANRVEDSELTQGGGSYMQFTKGNEDFTWEQLVNLIQSVRVVFISDTGAIYGVAAMQGLKYEPVMEDVYKTDADGKYLDADGNIIDQTQTGWEEKLVKTGETNVAYAAGTAGHDLADENKNAVTLTGCTVVTGDDGETYIKAPLKLYAFSVDDKGILTLSDTELASSSLTVLEQNVATAVTSLVYLDGDKVENSDVAISGSSMTGTMNLQFASDATLDPMDYTFTAEQLKAPETVSLDSATKQLTIKNVEKATNYVIYYNDGTSDTKLPVDIEAQAGENTVIDLTAALAQYSVPGTTYNFKVAATANGYTESTATAFTYTVPDATP